MIRTLVAYTETADDPKLAVSQILEQLAVPHSLLEHSVGIVACHYEFVYSGVYKAVCDALPFDVAGTVTPCGAAGQAGSTLAFSLMVLTSDDISFAASVTAFLDYDPGLSVGNTCRAALAGRETPSLILTFAPQLREGEAENCLRALTKAAGDVPCFGALAHDGTDEPRDGYALLNGEYFAREMVMVLLFGPFEPRLRHASLSRGKVIDLGAVVTRSAGRLVQEVGGQPAAAYFEGLGLSSRGGNLKPLPFLVYGREGPALSNVFLRPTDEGALCACEVPEGATFDLGVFDRDDVLETAAGVAQGVFGERQKPAGVLVYSDLYRAGTLDGEALAEVEQVQDALGGIPFLMAYSGGTFSSFQASGGWAGRFENSALVLCLF